jgi:biotin transport system substrate-specific component
MAQSTVSQGSGPLIDRIWAAGEQKLLRQVALALAGVAILTLSAKFKVPFYPVPMTLQTLAVLLIGAAYGWRLGMATVALYLAHGFFGAPVFAGTPPLAAGPAYFLGPTGGFLVAFLFSSAIAGYVTERGLHRSIPLLFVSFVAAEALVFTLGFGWLAFFATLASGGVGLGAEKAFALAVQPFVFGDLLKVSIVTALVTVFARKTA